MCIMYNLFSAGIAKKRKRGKQKSLSLFHSLSLFSNLCIAAACLCINKMCITSKKTDKKIRLIIFYSSIHFGNRLLKTACDYY